MLRRVLLLATVELRLQPFAADGIQQLPECGGNEAGETRFGGRPAGQRGHQRAVRASVGPRQALPRQRQGGVEPHRGDWAVSSLYNYHTGAPVNWTSDVIYYGGDLHWNAHNVNPTVDTTQVNTN